VSSTNRSFLPSGSRARAWVRAGLTFAALVFVPFFAWLVLPAPPHIQVPQAGAPSEETPVRTVSRPAFTAPPPRPAETEKPAEGTGPVKGFVLGPSRRPVGRAFIGCTEKNKDISTTTEQDGAFELPAAAVGCRAVATKPGFGSSEAVTLKAGESRENTLELRAGGRIEGVVVDEHGAPVTKYMLAVERFIGGDGDDEGSNGRARSIENDKGQFTMEDATPGKYVLIASSDGRPPAKTDILEVESGRATTGVKITLSRGAVLSGTVTDGETKRPIASARVELDSVTSSGVSSTPSVKTDESGAFSMEGVPPSEPFSIRVSKDTYRTRIVSGLTARGSGKVATEVQLQPKGTGSAESEMGGIGAVLAPSPDSLGAVVLATTKDSPAEHAGLQKQDRIVRIDGTSTDTLTLPDCIQRLRGEPGTRVTLWVKRGTQELQFTLTRALVVR